MAFQEARSSKNMTSEWPLPCVALPTSTLDSKPHFTCLAAGQRSVVSTSANSSKVLSKRKAAANECLLCPHVDWFHTDVAQPRKYWHARRSAILWQIRIRCDRKKTSQELKKHLSLTFRSTIKKKGSRGQRGPGVAVHKGCFGSPQAFVRDSAH